MGGDVVLRDYWSLLSPKAVEYSAGVINLFFQEVEKNKNNPEFTQKESPTFLAQVTGTIQNGWNSTKNFLSGVFGTGVQFEEVSNGTTETNNQNSTDNSDGINIDTAPETTTNSSQKDSSKQSNLPKDVFKVTRVIDGDTIVLENGTVIRYIGIDAPELAYQEGKSDCFAMEAQQRNKELVLNKNIRLEYIPGVKTDKYDRTLAYVWDGNNLANEILVSEGYAYAYNFGQKHPLQQDFENSQAQAKEAEIGIWGSSCKKESNQNSTTTKDITADDIKTNNQSENNPQFCQFETTKSPLRQNLIINEIAWMGTLNSSSDEWIEVKNISNSAVKLSGYQLVSKGNKIEINLSDASQSDINGNGFLLLERTDDNSVPNITADIIYSGALANTNDGLRLFDSECNLIDEVMASLSWPAGDSSSKRTAERDANSIGWHTSSIIGGTPKNNNSSNYSATSGSGGSGGGNGTVIAQSSQPKVDPQFYPIVINEIMYNPEGADSGNEWVELYNSGTSTVKISEWKFSEGETNHSLSLQGGSDSLESGKYAVIADDANQFKEYYRQFFGSPYDGSFSLFDSSFSLNNNGEQISIKNDTLKTDEVSYIPDWGGNGDGKSIQKFSDVWKGAIPTPGKENIYLEEGDKYSITPNRLVISELQVDGDNPEDEFVELYNPTQSPISLNGYSLQYISGQATSTQNIHSLRKITEDIIVPPFQFFLFANKNGKYANTGYDSDYSYSLSKESAIILLTNATTSISSLDDPTVADFVAYGNVEFPGIVGSPTPPSNKSIERLAIKNSLCTNPQNEGEFLGNACKTGISSTDFEIRQNPKPQKLENLAEPRIAPGQVNELKLSYSTSSNQLLASWQAPADNGAAKPFTYEINNNDGFMYETVAATSTYINIDEIGHDYGVEITAIDPEGLRSEKVSTSSSNIPSFLESLQFFEDPTISGTYIIEGKYDVFPFVPSPYSGRSQFTGSIMIFFLNHEAEKELYLDGGFPQNNPATSTILPLDYKHCSGISGINNLFAIADDDLCNHGGNLSYALPHEYLEDKVLSIKTPTSTSLSSSDYITVAFYAFDHSNLPSGGNDIFRLVAVDKTKYYLSDPMPAHNPPNSIANFTAEFHDELNNPHVLLKWDDAIDLDSVDKLITYEYAVSTGTPDISGLVWTKTQKGFSSNGETLTQIAPEISLTSLGNYTFYLRAKDELGLTSQIVSSNIDFYPPKFIAGVNEIKCDYCSTMDFVTAYNSNSNYKIGQTFKINSESKIKEIILELHNVDFPGWFKNQYNVVPSDFDAKISINSITDGQDPNSGLEELYSKTISGIPALIEPNKNYADIKLDSPITLEPGNYFVTIETIGGNYTSPSQVLSVSRTNSDKYSDGLAYSAGKPGGTSSGWRPYPTTDLFLKILGSEQEVATPSFQTFMTKPLIISTEPENTENTGNSDIPEEESDIIPAPNEIIEQSLTEFPQQNIEQFENKELLEKATTTLTEINIDKEIDHDPSENATTSDIKNNESLGGIPQNNSGTSTPEVIETIVDKNFPNDESQSTNDGEEKDKIIINNIDNNGINATEIE